MAQLVLGAAGAVVGGLIGGPTGAQIGWALGGALGSTLQTQKVSGPLSNDLRAPKLQYGSTISRIYGRQRVAGALAWSSEKRAIANTTSEGGKGGPTVETTTYTYEVDALFLLAIDSNVIAITRVWRNGELIFSALADAQESTIRASANTDAWSEITLFDGNPSQMPWSVYEDAVGVENASAYRHRTTVGIERWNLGGSDQLSLLEFEVITAGTPAAIDPLVILQCAFDRNSGADVSASNLGDGTLAGDAVIASGQYYTTETTTDPTYIEWGAADGTKLGHAENAAWTAEFYVTPYQLPAISFTHLFLWDKQPLKAGAWHAIGIRSNGAVCYDNPDGDTPNIIGSESISEGERAHVALVVPAGSSPTARLYVRGVLSASFTIANPEFVGSGVRIRVGWAAYTGGTTELKIDDVRVTLSERYTGSSFEPPASLSAADHALQVWDVENVDLADVVSAELQLSGLDPETFDVSELAGIEVRGIAAIGSARQVIEVLQAAYYFEWTCSDKLRARVRGGGLAATIGYEKLAAGLDGATDVAFDPQRGQDEEIPARFALTAYNLSADYEKGTELGDRLVTIGADTQKLELPIVFLPEEIKGRALAMALDAKPASTTATISLGEEFAEIECCDVISVPDRGGTTYRMRVLREQYSQGVKTLDLCRDDPTALVSVGIASTDRTPSIEVTPPADSEARFLDVPTLRDADDGPGLVIAVAPATAASWPGAAIFSSRDGVEYSLEASMTDRAVFGACVDALGDWTGGRVFDEVNSVVVDVNGGALASCTRAAMLADRTVNVAAVGAHGRWEIVRFRTATLDSDGFYTLSGLLRGCLGTEWAVDTHQSGDSFVLLRPAGLRKIAQNLGDIGALRYFQTPTLGRSRATADAVAFTQLGVNLMPYAPCDARAARDGDDVVITWRRRTRRETRFLGTIGSSTPLGEETESYSIDVLDSGVVLRTLTSTSETVTYTGAQQTEDGLTPGDPVTVRIYQLSAAVGRGYPLEATL